MAAPKSDRMLRVNHAMSSGGEVRKSVFRGIAWGAATWIVYGVVETVLSISIQLWHFRDTEVLYWQWPLIGVLLATYAGIGISVGTLGGLFLGLIHKGASHRIFAALTVAVAFGANLVAAWPLARSEQMALAVTAFLIAGLTAGLFSKLWLQRLGFLAGPWTISLVLLIIPWVSRELLTPRYSSLIKVGLSIFLLCLIVTIAAIAGSLRRHRVSTAFGQFLGAAAAFAAYAGAVAVWQRVPPVDIRLSPAVAARPNLVFIVMDTVRADHLSALGYARDTTPNLRELARTATTYSRAIAASDFTLSSHAAMFTGLYPDWNGAIQSTTPRLIAHPLDDHNTTLAEVLRANGYWTMESAANTAFLGPWAHLSRGFAASALNRPLKLSDLNRPFYLRQAAIGTFKWLFHITAFDRPLRIAEDVNRSALNFLESANRSHVPFFLFINYMDAHTPYVPAAPFDRRFSIPGEAYMDPAGLKETMWEVDSNRRRLTDAENGYLIGEYDGGIASEDAAIAGVLDRLKKLGLYDNTLVLITGDHGNAFGDHGLMDHFIGFLYQELVHIPLFIKYPHQHEPRQSEELVSHVDLMPTVLDALGINTELQFQGRSLLKSCSEDVAVFSRGIRSPVVGLGNQRFNGLRRAVFYGNLKLILWTAGPPELYDLASDPQEQHNLYSAEDPRARELARRLDNWVASFPGLTSRPQELDAAAIERLKSLGYVQ